MFIIPTCMRAMLVVKKNGGDCKKKCSSCATETPDDVAASFADKCKVTHSVEPCRCGNTRDVYSFTCDDNSKMVWHSCSSCGYFDAKAIAATKATSALDSLASVDGDKVKFNANGNTITFRKKEDGEWTVTTSCRSSFPVVTSHPAATPFAAYRDLRKQLADRIEGDLAKLTAIDKFITSKLGKDIHNLDMLLKESNKTNKANSSSNNTNKKG